MTKQLVAAAAGGLLLGTTAGVSAQPQPDTEPGDGDGDALHAADHADVVALDNDCCKGTNECKGQGHCKTDAHECAGKNECKGQGGCMPADCPEKKPDNKTPVP